MTHAMEEKIQMLEEYIGKLTEAIETSNTVSAKHLQKEVIAVYDNEIDGLRNELDNYSIVHSFGETPVDFIHDAKLLSAKLRNYKINLTSGLHKIFRNDEGAVNVTQNVQQKVQNNITISLEQTVSDINSLPQGVLSDEDKEILCGKLASLSTQKTTVSKWEKAQNVLKWIAEKGFEVGKIALPYVLQTVFNTPT